jgi:hypothetical protein
MEATMLNPSEPQAARHQARADLRLAPPAAHLRDPGDRHHGVVHADETIDDESPVEWTEEDIVFLHWRLLQEVSDLSDPETPLETKLDTLRWVFTDRSKDRQPFSFVSCLRVVGCSPLSPIAYCGLVDAEEVRDRIRHSVKAWLAATLERYPEWVREAVVRNPEWVEARLARNPQCINEQIRAQTFQGDLFA